MKVFKVSTLHNVVQSIVPFPDQEQLRLNVTLCGVESRKSYVQGVLLEGPNGFWEEGPPYPLFDGMKSLMSLSSLPLRSGPQGSSCSGRWGLSGITSDDMVLKGAQTWIQMFTFSQAHKNPYPFLSLNAPHLSFLKCTSLFILAYTTQSPGEVPASINLHKAFF